MTPRNLILPICLTVFSAAFAQNKTAAPVKPTTTAKPTTAAKTVTTAKPVAPPKPAGPVFKTPIDSLSYAIGMLDGKFFASQGLTSANSQLMAKGFNDAVKGTMAITPEEADQLIRRQLQALGRKKIQPAIDSGAAFLAANAKKPGIRQTPSGLQYEVLVEGAGDSPKDTSMVKVHYVGSLLNGTIFDSSRERGEPATFPLNQVIRGWTEGVQLMKVGSRYRFWIPYNLAYGEQGAGDRIPGGSLLVFDVELLEIVKGGM